MAGGLSPVFNAENKAWILNIAARIWFELPPMYVARLSHSCGYSEDPEGNPVVIVSGGYNQEARPVRTEVLDLKVRGPDSR